MPTRPNDNAAALAAPRRHSTLRGGTLAKQPGQGKPIAGETGGMADWRKRRFDWLELVLASAELSPRAKVLGAAFVTVWADKRTGEFNPSYSTIAKAIGGCSEKTVIRAVNELFSAGWISVRPGLGRGNYTVYALRMVRSDQFSERRRRTDLSGKSGQNCPRPYKEEPRKRNPDARGGGREAHRDHSRTAGADAAEDAERQAKRRLCAQPGTAREGADGAALSATERAEICRSLGLAVLDFPVAGTC